MAYKYDTSKNARFYTPTNGRAITGIVIHHWGSPGQSFDGVVGTFVNCPPENKRSAHYVVEDGRVSCLVACKDIAWHAGVWDVNSRTIGIECRPECTEGDRETVAHLIADLWRVYGRLPLSMHRDYVATACPGKWADYLGWLAQRAAQILDGGTTPTPAPAPDPRPADVDALAHAVIRGDYGVGEERRRRLGGDYDRVQARVNELLGAAATPAPDIDALAHAVIRGDYGNGEQRRAALGALYDRVQARVNELLGGA